MGENDRRARCRRTVDNQSVPGLCVDHHEIWIPPTLGPTVGSCLHLQIEYEQATGTRGAVILAWKWQGGYIGTAR